MPPIFQRMSGVGAWARGAVIGLVVCELGCAAISKRSAGGATESSLEALEKKFEELRAEEETQGRNTSVFGERMGRGVVSGSMEMLSTPEVRRQLAASVEVAVTSAIQSLATAPTQGGLEPGSGMGGSGETETALQQIADQLATRFATTFSGELQRQLGAQGEGPLGQSLSVGTGQVTDSVLRGLAAPAACEPGQSTADCLKQATFQMGRSASQGAVRGAIDEAPWLWILPLFLVGVLAGAVGAVVVFWVRDAEPRAGRLSNAPQPARTIRRMPRWQVEVSIGCAIRAAGR